MTSFYQSLKTKRQSGLIPVIPDIKLLSPKEGDLLRGRCPVAAAQLFEQLGAPAISVVTEPHDFGGSLELLHSVSSAVSIPVLRKDFISCEADLLATREHGAAAILLICSCLEPPQLSALYYAALQLGIEPLVEAHTEQELRFAATLQPQLVGINNRDILALERDDGTVATTAGLISLAPPGALLISESGIATPGQARAAIDCGADAVLIGTALWQAEDMGSFYQQLCRGEGADEAADR